MKFGNSFWLVTAMVMVYGLAVRSSWKSEIKHHRREGFSYDVTWHDISYVASRTWNGTGARRIGLAEHALHASLNPGFLSPFQASLHTFYTVGPPGPALGLRISGLFPDSMFILTLIEVDDF